MRLERNMPYLYLILSTSFFEKLQYSYSWKQLRSLAWVTYNFYGIYVTYQVIFFFYTSENLLTFRQLLSFWKTSAWLCSENNWYCLASKMPSAAVHTVAWSISNENLWATACSGYRDASSNAGRSSLSPLVAHSRWRPRSYERGTIQKPYFAYFFSFDCFILPFQ